MKKIFVLGALIGFFLLGSSAAAWQDPCILQDYDFIMSDEYVLMNFTDDNTGFSPRTDCAGDVTIFCPDDRECILPYNVWGETLIIGENMYDMNFKLLEDNRLIPQNDANWEDVLARNGCAASEPPVCDSNHLNLCEDQTACEFVGGHWCDETCQVNECCPPCPTCDNCTECPPCDNCTECPPCDCNATEPFVCPLLDNTYQYDMPDISYLLENFQCEVGPGCRGYCDLKYGNFDVGPAYTIQLPFDCLETGITISNLPCGMYNGNLKCLVALVGNFYCYQIGHTQWCFQTEQATFLFKTSEAQDK